ncbi:MAG: potassium efflux system [Rhizobium sp.]|nr:potassium efflux system [Rhizobium sp.]
MLLAFLAIVPAHLFAQTQDAIDKEQGQNAIVAAVEALQEQVRTDLQKAAVSLEDLRKKVEEAAKADSQLAQLKVQADTVGKIISKAMGELENRYNLVAKRLEEIGTPPAEGQPAEDTGVTGDRKRLQGEKAQMNTILSDGEVLNKEAENLSGHITDLRRKLFTETLFRYTEINGQLLEDTVNAAGTETAQLWSRTASALDFMWKFKGQGLFITLGLMLVMGMVLIALVRSTFASFIRRDMAERDPSYTHRLAVAFWSTMIPSLAAAIFVFVGLMLLAGFNVLREDIGDILRAILWAIVGIYFVWQLSRGIVAPGKPQWRLVDVSDRRARTLVTFSVILAAINGLSYVFGQANIALDAPVVLTVAEGFLSSIITGITLILLSFARPMETGADARGSWPKLIRFLFIFAGLSLILTALFGYIGLAQFAATQIVVTGAILVTMYIGFLSGHAISRHDAFGKTATGRYLERRFGIHAIRLDQLGLAAGLGVHVLVILVGLPLIMLTWGFRGADIWLIFVQLFTEIRIGNISISLLGIIAGIMVFIGGYFATRWFQQWLDGNVMARSQIDLGVRNSVNTALGYAGIAIAGIIGISAAGINLSSLALVAGALSLGIGFGLQTIVQNFVSGLILLAERPFKVGDWIVAGPVEGFVRRISVRATEVETFQNQSIIVPNSQLINASVGNWTLRNTLARSEVAVKVSYDSDPRKVMDILLEIATSHPLVLTMPEPNVGFNAFGEFSLDFELRFYLADLFNGGAVKNDIRVSIIERFRKEGIEIPMPQRNLNIRFTEDDDALENAMRDEGMSPDAARRIREQIDRRRKTAEAKARDIDKVDDGSHPDAHDPGEPRHSDDDGEER